MGAVKLSDLKPGDVITIDDGFPCAHAGDVVVHADAEGALFFRCEEGEHYLEGQCDGHDQDALAGVVDHAPAKTGV